MDLYELGAGAYPESLPTTRNLRSVRILRRRGHRCGVHANPLARFPLQNEKSPGQFVIWPDGVVHSLPVAPIAEPTPSPAAPEAISIAGVLLVHPAGGESWELAAAVF